jgi:hypothetical protein
LPGDTMRTHIMPRDLKAVRDQIAAAEKKKEVDGRPKEHEHPKTEQPKKVRVISKYDREY